jgi:RNA polymerase sigma-70 factor (ECF subfamily)
MSSDDPDRPLNCISTLWTVVCQAQGGPTAAATAAQERLIQRYGRAVYRYLRGALRDSDAAEDLAQEFALRFIRGDFRGADRQRGRFRDFVRGVLSHLIADHYRRQPRVQPLPASGLEPAELAQPADDTDREFLESWREELLSHAWQALEQVQNETSQPFYTVLRFRIDYPTLRSAQLAEQLGQTLGKPISAAGIRQTLHRARARFADLLLDQVAQTLASPSADDLQQELVDLGLLKLCEPALQRFRHRT